MQQEPNRLVLDYSSGADPPKQTIFFNSACTFLGGAWAGAVLIGTATAMQSDYNWGDGPDAHEFGLIIGIAIAALSLVSAVLLWAGMRGRALCSLNRLTVRRQRWFMVAGLIYAAAIPGMSYLISLTSLPQAAGDRLGWAVSLGIIIVLPIISVVLLTQGREPTK